MEKITKKQWLGLIGISILSFTCFLDITIVANALPAIRKSLSASDTELQWLLNTIYVALTALMATMGRMGDVLGLRKVFYISMLIMASASFACGISTTIEQLIFFRVIQGITFASITIAFALVAHNFSTHFQPKGMSICSAIAGTGIAFGPVIGGLIVQYLNWRWVFFINVPIVAIGLLICIFCVTEKKEHEQESIDWLGAFFFIIAISSLVTTVIEAPQGWSHSAIFIGLFIAATALLSFILVEKKVKTPLMPFSLLANSVFISASLTCFTCGSFIAVLLFFNPLYLQTIVNFSPSISGWILFSASLAYVLISPIAAYITKHLTPKIGTWLVCLLLMIAAFFHSLFGLHPNLIIILLGLITFGMAWGTVNVPPVVAVLQNVKPSQSAVMLGALWTLFNLGSCLVLALAGFIFRFFEYRFLLKNLEKISSVFTTQEMTLLQQLVNEPEQSKQIINQFPPLIANQIMPAYKAAFVDSFHQIMWLLFILATLAFFEVVFFMKNSSRKSEKI